MDILSSTPALVNADWNQNISQNQGAIIISVQPYLNSAFEK